MEDINFSALAPRRGTRPMLSSWSSIGTSQMNGGAINWGNLWSGVKNFGSSLGSSLKSWGSKAWNSNTGQMLREKLKDSGVQEKIADGIASGIHGAIDLTRQEIDRAIQSKLEKRPTVEALEKETLPMETIPTMPAVPAPKPPPVVTEIKKRPRDEEEIVIKNSEPPSYDEIFGNQDTPVPIQNKIMPPPTRPPKVIGIRKPSRGSNWQSTLQNIVGLGVNVNKKRRCY